MARRPRRFHDDLDGWFGTLARYVGLTVLVYAFTVDRLKTPALPGIGFGLMLVRNTLKGGE